MKKLFKLQLQRARRKKRSRAQVTGTAEKPRISVFRSNKYLSVQFIDDAKGHTLVSFSTRALSGEKKKKTEKAIVLGERVAEAAKKLGVNRAVLAKGQYKFHGQLKAFVEAARKNGLTI